MKKIARWLRSSHRANTFKMAWEAARPNAIVTIVAMYDKPQVLPLPDMYGKNLIFKTGGVDGCNCAETFELIRHDDKIKGLELGADDYIAKPFHLAELSMRIYRIIRRKKFTPPIHWRTMV